MKMVQLHLPHLGVGGGGSNQHQNERREREGPPKGWVAIRVGQEGEEQLQRFVVPVAYLNHPLFLGLLKEAEEEYGFEHKGAITIPCHVEYFRRVVQGIVNRDSNAGGHHGHFHLCFKA